GLLGYRTTQDIVVPGSRGTSRLMTMTGATSFGIVLCEADAPTHPIRKWIDLRGPGVHHLAHRVESLQLELDLALPAGAVAIGSVATSDGLRQVFTEVADDGLLHELTERTIAGFVPKNSSALIEAGATRNADRQTLPPPAFSAVVDGGPLDMARVPATLS